MTPFRITFYLAGISALLCSCTAHQYIPSPQYVPLHKSKGEFIANLYMMPFALQAGYTVTDHVFVFATAYNKIRNARPYISKESGGQETFLGRSSEVNLGAGYFTRKNQWVFEVAGGGGIGKMSYSHEIDNTSDYIFSTEARKVNAFVQPVIGLKVDDHIEVGLFSRVNAVRYYDIISGIPARYPIDKDDLAFAAHRTVDVLFLEPGIFMNAGWRNVKFTIQMGGSDEIAGAEIRNKSFLFRSGVSATIGKGSK
jgi:hypothetical protein